MVNAKLGMVNHKASVVNNVHPMCSLMRPLTYAYKKKKDGTESQAA